VQQSPHGPFLCSGNLLTNRWRLGEREKVITAFSRHVGAIRRLHQHLLERGYLWYQTIEGETKRLEISLSVHGAT